MNKMAIYQREMFGDPEYRPFKAGDKVRLRRAKGFLSLEIERVEDHPDGKEWYRCRDLSGDLPVDYRYYARHDELTFDKPTVL